MKRGDVLCRFPHASATPSKVRPALVVQSDYYTQRIQNLLVAGITGNLTKANDPAHYLLDVSISVGQQSGLNRNSLVSCINLAIIPSHNVDRVIGSLPRPAMDAVEVCIL